VRIGTPFNFNHGIGTQTLTYFRHVVRDGNQLGIEGIFIAPDGKKIVCPMPFSYLADNAPDGNKMKQYGHKMILCVPT
jgi:hypothetical protein